jgi:hypothetical protein
LLSLGSRHDPADGGRARRGEKQRGEGSGETFEWGRVVDMSVFLLAGECMPTSLPVASISMHASETTEKRNQAAISALSVVNSFFEFLTVFIVFLFSRKG